MTNARRIAFRFDVDTHRCAGPGLRALLDLADEFAVPFTFYVNMGRAASWPALLRKRLRKTPTAAPRAAGLGMRDKLGIGGTLVAATLNPRVGLGQPDLLRRAHRSGHELGLHGGRNHGTWHHDALHWPSSRIAAEVGWGLAALQGVTGHRPRGFASPGWTSPAGLAGILTELGFDYLADRHGPQHDLYGTDAESGMGLLATALAGEPGGVGYLEHHRALGSDAAALITSIRAHSDAAGPTMLYDHPCFAGGAGLDLMRATLIGLLEQGFSLVRADQLLPVPPNDAVGD